MPCPKHPKVINWNKNDIDFYFHTSLWCLRKVSSFWGNEKMCENKKFMSLFLLFRIGTSTVKTVFVKLPTYAISVSLTTESRKNNIDTSSHRRYSAKKGVLRNFAKSQENTWATVSFLRDSERDSGTGVFLWILRNFSEHLFYRITLGGSLYLELLTNSSIKQYFSQSLIKWNWHFQRVTAKHYRIFPGKWYNTILLFLSDVNLF